MSFTACLHIDISLKSQSRRKSVGFLARHLSKAALRSDSSIAFHLSRASLMDLNHALLVISHCSTSTRDPINAYTFVFPRLSVAHRVDTPLGVLARSPTVVAAEYEFVDEDPDHAREHYDGNVDCVETSVVHGS